MNILTEEDLENELKQEIIGEYTEAPTIRFVNALLIKLIFENEKTMEIEPANKSLNINISDKILMKQPLETLKNISLRLKTISNLDLNIDEEQIGLFKTKIMNKKYTFLFKISPFNIKHEKIVIKIVNFDSI